jgi:hypothetical protein
MNVQSLGSSSYNQMFQPADKSGGQTIRQQSAQPQGPPEESRESASVQKAESAQPAEGGSSQSIDFYA